MSKELIRYYHGDEPYTYRLQRTDQPQWQEQEDKTLTMWEGLEDKGMVRLVIHADDYYNMDDLKGDSYNPEVNDNIDPKELKRQERNFEQRIRRSGVWGLSSEYKDKLGHWCHADSCWGFVGNDWKNSGYDRDIMQGAIDAHLKDYADDLNDTQDDHLDCVGA